MASGAARTLLVRLLLAVIVCASLPSITWSQQAGDKPAPGISFDKVRFNFGNVKEGIRISHRVKVLNRGNAPLEIDKVIASCGCTVPTMKVKTIRPGKSEELEVVLDTTVKQGTVTKEIQIFSNDPQAPKSSVYVIATVENIHKGLTQVEKAKLFKGKCGICHWKIGLGLEGEDLFKADCGMCHGMEAKGAKGIGPALIPIDFSNPAVLKHVKQVTSFGSKKHLSMPGFSQEVGGPLTEKEIDSIVKHLAELSSRKKS